MANEQMIKIENFNVTALEEIKGKEALIASVIKENPFVKVVDTKTYEDAKKFRTALRTCRTDLEKEEKALHAAIKKHLTEPVKNIYFGFKEKVTPLEEKQQQEVKAWEDIKEQERLEKLRIEEERKQKHRINIDLFFKHNKELIENLEFDKLPHEIDYTIGDQEFSSQMFEEFADIFDAKLEILHFQLADRSRALQEKETIRLEKLRLDTARNEMERMDTIKHSIEFFYARWIDLISDMKFSDIKKLTKQFNSERPLECAEFKQDYDTKKENLARVLESKSNLLTSIENQRVEQELLEKKKAALERTSIALRVEKQFIEEQKIDAKVAETSLPESTIKKTKPIEEIEVFDPIVVRYDRETVLLDPHNTLFEKRQKIIEWVNQASEAELDRLTKQFLSHEYATTSS